MHIHIIYTYIYISLSVAILAQVEVTWVEVVVAKEQVKATSWVVVVVTWVEVAFHVGARRVLAGRFKSCRKRDLLEYRANADISFVQDVSGGNSRRIFQALRPRRPVNRSKGFQGAEALAGDWHKSKLPIQGQACQGVATAFLFYRVSWCTTPWWLRWELAAFAPTLHVRWLLSWSHPHKSWTWASIEGSFVEKGTRLWRHWCGALARRSWRVEPPPVCIISQSSFAWISSTPVQRWFSGALVKEQGTSYWSIVLSWNFVAEHSGKNFREELEVAIGWALQACSSSLAVWMCKATRGRHCASCSETSSAHGCGYAVISSCSFHWHQGCILLRCEGTFLWHNCPRWMCRSGCLVSSLEASCYCIWGLHKVDCWVWSVGWGFSARSPSTAGALDFIQ